MDNSNQQYEKLQFIDVQSKDTLTNVFDNQIKQFKIQKIIPITKNSKSDIINEVQLQKQLKHQNIIQIFDHYVSEEFDSISNQNRSYLHIFMNSVAGQTLDKRLGKFKQQQFLSIYKQLRKIIQYLENKKIFLKNIKLNSIVITRDGQINLNIIQNTIQFKQFDGSDFYQPPQFTLDIMNNTSILWSVGIILIQLLMGITIQDIYKIYNISGTPKTNPQELKQFILTSSDIKQEIVSFLLSLIQEDYHKRQFYPTYMNLSSQRLVYDSLEQKLIECQYLNKLDISNCNLTDECIELISNTCKSLNILDASGNQLSDVSIKHLHKNNILSRLTELNVAFTNITDESLVLIIEHGQMITSLDISYTKIGCTIQYQYISRLTNLSCLYIWGGQFCEYPSRYYNHIDLNLAINWVKYLDNVMSVNSQCLKQLKLKQMCIVLYQNYNSDQLIELLDEQAICVEINRSISKQNLQKLGKMNKLSKVYLRQGKYLEINQLQSKELESVALIQSDIKMEKIITWLSNCKKLKHLDLNSNTLGDEDVIMIATHLNNLTTLDLHNNKIGSQGAIQIATHLTNLTKLNLNWNQIGPQGATFIANNIRNLKILQLDSNQIGVQGAKMIANHLKNLVTLNIADNHIGAQGIIMIATNLDNLTTLDLQLNNIGDQGAIVIAHRLNNLTFLELGNNNIGNQGATAIATYLNNLIILNLNNNNIGQQGAIAIATHQTKLMTVDLRNNYISVDEKKFIRQFLKIAFIN